jgi:hypothetical protein
MDAAYDDLLPLEMHLDISYNTRRGRSTRHTRYTTSRIRRYERGPQPIMRTCLLGYRIYFIAALAPTFLDHTLIA